MLTIHFDRLGLRDGDNVLDLGCGVGRHVITAYTLKNIRSVGVDLCHEDLKTAKDRFTKEFAEKGDREKSFQLFVADALSLPFSDNRFDKIICSEVLEHIPDYQSVIKEIYRVLKPGGVLAVSVPRYYPEWICWKLSHDYHNEKGGHIRIFNARQLRRAIETRGFLFFHTHWAHSLHVPYWWLQCLFWKNRERSKIVNIYHRFLVWDLIKRPRITQIMDKVLNPLMGKSVVMYFNKET